VVVLLIINDIADFKMEEVGKVIYDGHVVRLDISRVKC